LAEAIKVQFSLVRVYLVVGQFKPRLSPVGEYLPQQDAEAPDVGLNSERSIQQALGRHPAYR